jgi:hypothetical protein
MDGGLGLEQSGSELGPLAGSCEHTNEPMVKKKKSQKFLN